MPCLDEAETIEMCIIKARQFLNDNGINGEILISDNGSTDGSDSLARKMGARVSYVKERGYGHALINGIWASKGKYVIMGDADDSYNFEEIMPFLEKLREGYEFVMGNRFAGEEIEGAMPFLNRYLGTPVISGIGRFLSGSKVTDFNCGLRGFNAESMMGLSLCHGGMEFASEMVAKASVYGLKTCEVPVTLYKDGRSRPPHLRPVRDGIRHLKFLFGYAVQCRLGKNG